MMSPGEGRPVRVLHLITRLVHGGAQENTLLTAYRMRSRGFEPTVVTGPAVGPEGSLMERCRELGIPLRVVPELVREPDIVMDLKALVRVMGIVRRGSFDLMHTHTSKAGFVGRLAGRLTRMPAVVHTPHGHIFHDYYGVVKTSFYTMLERLAAGMTDRILTLSHLEADDHLRLQIGSRKDFVHVPSGVDFSRFDAAADARCRARRALALPQDCFVVGSVGRLAPVKGHRYLLEAVASLAKIISNLRVVLVGDGQLLEELRLQALTLGIREQVIFTGLLKDVWNVLPAMDAAVFPSLNEGMGRAIAEAMYCELPVIASRVGGVPELLAHGDAGVLVPPRDPGAIALALRNLYLDPQRRCTLGAQARKHVIRDYSLDEMVRRLERIYTELL